MFGRFLRCALARLRAVFRSPAALVVVLFPVAAFSQGVTGGASSSGAGLPTATAAGQGPISDGAGTNYSARPLANNDGTNAIFAIKPPKAFYDAAVLQTADAVTPASWPDSSGNGYTATGGGAGIAMNRQTTIGVPAVHFDGTAAYTLPAGLAVSAQNHSVCFTFETSNGGTTATGVILNLAGAAYYIHQQAGSSPYKTAEFHINSTFRAPFGAQTQAMCVVSGASSAIVYTPYETYVTAALSAGASAGGWIGSFNGTGFFAQMNLFAMPIWDSQITATDVLGYFAYSTSRFHTAVAGSQPGKAVLFSDSIGVGGFSTRERTYVNRSFAAGKAGQGLPFIENSGLGGTTWQQAAASCATIAASYDSTFPLNIAIGAWGANDITINSRTAVQIEGDIATVAACVKAAHPLHKFLISTVTPYNNAGCTLDATRLTLNAWMKAGGIANVDGVIDYSVDPNIDVCVSGGNSTYYGSDPTHPNDQGNQNMSVVFGKQLAAFIAAH